MRIVTLLFVLMKFEWSFGEDEHLPESRYLSELPLERLLSIKQAFSDEKWCVSPESEDLEEENGSSSCIGDDSVCPKAEPLIMDDKNGLWKRGGGGGWSSGGKKSKSKSSKKSKILGKLFQSSVTALSFLAFGGYLLCLIVRGIRQKNADVNMMMNMNMPAAQTGGRKRRALPPLDEKMYQALIHISEGYVKYHQVTSSK